MRSAADPSPVAAAAPTSLAIDNLRGIVILLVLAFHSVLAYLSVLPARPFAFDAAPYLWRSFPIVDQVRWFGFDLFCAWLDVFLMSFFFLLSGLFAWPSLGRKGERAFLADRLVRLGVPFLAVVTLLIPVAHYPTYLQTAAEAGGGTLADYWRHWQTLPFWPSGPVWFLWLLLVGDAAAAGLHLLPKADAILLRLSAAARQRPDLLLMSMMAVAALAYVPLALVFGISDWCQFGPFAFQLSRPLHYAVYFFAGVVIGACGIERGLLAPDGPLPRQWRRWLVAAPLLFALWGGLTGMVIAQGAAAPLPLRLAADLSFTAACFSSCFLVLAAAVRFGRRRLKLLDPVTANAYGMYLVHYPFVVWLQFALLAVALAAIAKAAIVFAVTLALSWSLTAALRQVPAFAHVLGAGRRRVAAAASPPWRYPGSGRPAGGGAAPMGGR